jgi:hypothetical protein
VLKRCGHCGQYVDARGFDQHRSACYTKARNTTGDHRPKHSSSAKWKKLRAEILERDGHRCQAHLLGLGQCDVTEGLEVAHLGQDWRDDDPAGLLSLCVPHHRRYDARPQL